MADEGWSVTSRPEFCTYPGHRSHEWTHRSRMSNGEVAFSYECAHGRWSSVALAKAFHRKEFGGDE